MDQGGQRLCGLTGLAQCWAISCCLLFTLSTITPVHAVSVSGLLHPASLLVHSSQELLSAVLTRMQPANITIPMSSKSTTWALLVAGSSGWENYRHQSDVLRSYHIVRRNGIRPENIVTMLYDDIAHNESNPYPGLVFNEPGGPDVYQGVPIDYRGGNITARTFLDVLLGNRTAVAAKGSGKVIASGPNDKVFVFYSDHGSVGLLKFPAGRDLSARQLLDALKVKHSRKGYKQLVFYVESCYSGSMFSGMHPHDWNVLAITAAQPDQLSYATHCRGDSTNEENNKPTIGWNSNIDTDNIYACLGDEFSVAWMRDSEGADTTGSSLWSQYERVKFAVKDSNVMFYGDTGLGLQPISNAQGGTLLPELQNTTGRSSNGGRRMLRETAGGSSSSAQSQVALKGSSMSVSQYDADLLGLRYIALSTRDPSRRADADSRYQHALQLRNQADRAAENAAILLLQSNDTNSKVVDLANENLPAENPTKWATVEANGGGSMQVAEAGTGSEIVQAYASQLIYGLNGRQPGSGKQLVDDWDCFEAMINAWSEQVSIWTNYARRHTRFFANLCNAGVTPEQFKQALKAKTITLGG